MLIDEIKASLAMENLFLEADEERLLADYIAGRLSLEEVKNSLASLIALQKKAA